MISYAEGLRTSRAQLLATAIDAGRGASAKLTIYTGTKPPPGAATTDQLALAVFTFSHPCAKTIAGGGADLETPSRTDGHWQRRSHLGAHC